MKNICAWDVCLTHLQIPLTFTHSYRLRQSQKHNKKRSFYSKLADMKNNNRILFLFSVILPVLSIFCFSQKKVGYFFSGCYLLYIATILFLLLFESNKMVRKALEILVSPLSRVYQLSQNKIFQTLYTSIIVVTLSLAVVVIVDILILNFDCICDSLKLILTFSLIILFSIIITSPLVESFINKYKFDPMGDYRIRYGRIVVYACYLFTIVWNAGGYLIGGIWYSDILSRIVIPAFLSYVIIDRLQRDIVSMR